MVRPHQANLRPVPKENGGSNLSSCKNARIIITQGPSLSRLKLVIRLALPRPTQSDYTRRRPLRREPRDPFAAVGELCRQLNSTSSPVPVAWEAPHERKAGRL